jgi:pimeloyl-ACP methyl ester carboxylesterase
MTSASAGGRSVNESRKETAVNPTQAKVDARTLKVPGATLYYEVRGSGPMLLCIPGGPTDAGIFSDLAGRLADSYTVVTYDPRGHSRSPLDAEPEDIPASLHADDAAAFIAAMRSLPANVYGSSGGGTIGLELVARHPELVSTLVAHEAPMMELLPDAEAWRSRFLDMVETYRADGVFAAMAKFGAAVEEGGPKYSEEIAQVEPTPESQEMGARMAGNFELFIAHELLRSAATCPTSTRSELPRPASSAPRARPRSSRLRGARRSRLRSASASRSPTSPAATAVGGPIRRSSPRGSTKCCREPDVEALPTAPTYS